MRKWEAGMLCGVVLLHVAAGAAMWWRWPPSVDRKQATADMVTLLTFDEVAGPARRADPAARSSRVAHAVERRDRRTSRPSPGDSSPASPQRRADATPLDLRLAPVPPLTTGVAGTDFLDPAPAIDYQRTRYEQGWVSEGNLTHVTARRSKVAAVALAVLGALIEPCTDDDRARYRRGCTPDQYRHDAEAALRDAGSLE